MSETWTCPTCGFVAKWPSYTAGDCSRWTPVGGWPPNVGLHWPSGQPITLREAELIAKNQPKKAAIR